MYRVDHPTGSAALAAPTAPTATPNRYYFGGNESLGQPATIVEAEHLNMIQEELCNVVLGSGAALSKSLRNQLFTAVGSIVSAAIDTARPVPLSVAQGGTGATSFPVQAGLGLNGVLLIGSGTNAVSGFTTWGFDALNQLRGIQFGAAMNAIPYLNLIKARGTAAAPTAAQNGDSLGAIYFDGWPTAADSSAFISATATQNQTTTTRGAKVQLFACQDGSTGASGLGPGLMLDQDQTVNITSFVSPLGALRLCGPSGFNVGGNAATWFGIAYAPSNNSQGLWLSSTGDLEISGTASKPTAGGWTATSDIRMKEDIEPYQHGLNELLALEPIEFTYKNRKGRYVGLDAAKAREVMPEMISVGGRGMLMMDPHALTFALINAVKELAAAVATLKNGRA